MKIKGHVIAKVILIIPLALFFITMGAMLKSIPEDVAMKQHQITLDKPTTTFFDRMDKWSELKSDELYNVVKVMSDRNIVIYSILISVIMVLLLDLTAGVGRSRSEERVELRKQRDKLL